MVICVLLIIMKKPVIIVFILLIITLGLLWHIKRTIEITASAVIPELKSENRPSGLLKITFLDVGQGDAGFINFPDGEKMLVDCGQDARILSALGRVLPYYERDLDYLVITHPDSDHYGGCIDVLKRFSVKNIITNGLRKPGDNFWEWFWGEAQNERANYKEIDAEETLNIASTTVHFLYPDASIRDLPITFKKKDNNTSIMFAIEKDNKKILFTADAENELEQYLLNKYKEVLNSDILKVAHHGSSGSSGRLFLEAVSPAYAVISVGKENTFGHPSLRVLKKLERVGAKILRTDEGGDVVCEVGDVVGCAQGN